MNKTFGALDPDKQTAFTSDLLALMGRGNRSKDRTLVCPSEYLEVADREAVNASKGHGPCLPSSNSLEGATLRGRLYVQPGRVRPPPVVVMAHGLWRTMSAMDGRPLRRSVSRRRLRRPPVRPSQFRHERRLSRAQQINKWIQARGYRDAMTFLGDRSDVDAARMALWRQHERRRGHRGPAPSTLA